MTKFKYLLFISITLHFNSFSQNENKAPGYITGVIPDRLYSDINYKNPIKLIVKNDDETLYKYLKYFYNINSDRKMEFQIDKTMNVVFAIEKFNNGDPREIPSRGYKYYVYAFHPFLGPFKFKFDNDGFKLFPNQRPVKLETIERDYFEEKGKDEYGHVSGGYGVINKNKDVILKFNTYDQSTQLDRLANKVGGETDWYWGFPVKYYNYIDKKEYNDSGFIVSINYRYEDKSDPQSHSNTEVAMLYDLGLRTKEQIAAYFQDHDKRKVAYPMPSLLNFNGYEVIPQDCFDLIRQIEGRYYITRNKGKYGLLKLSLDNLTNDKWIAYENIYDSLNYLGDSLLVAMYNGKSGIIDFGGRVLIDFSDRCKYFKLTDKYIIKQHINEETSFEVLDKKTFSPNSFEFSKYTIDNNILVVYRKDSIYKYGIENLQLLSASKYVEPIKYSPSELFKIHSPELYKSLGNIRVYGVEENCSISGYFDNLSKVFNLCNIQGRVSRGNLININCIALKNYQDMGDEIVLEFEGSVSKKTDRYKVDRQIVNGKVTGKIVNNGSDSESMTLSLVIRIGKQSRKMIFSMCVTDYDGNPDCGHGSYSGILNKAKN